MTNNTVITRDVPNKKLHVTRAFNAPVEKVWKSWTDASLLDKWWAPKPWRAETKKLDFSAGGSWLYAMIGPDGTTAWCKLEYLEIVPRQYFTSLNIFCDENGQANPDFPVMHWTVRFLATNTGSSVGVEIRFDKEADLNRIVDMGFEAGFTMGLGNLEVLLAG